MPGRGRVVQLVDRALPHGVLHIRALPGVLDLRRAVHAVRGRRVCSALHKLLAVVHRLHHDVASRIPVVHKQLDILRFSRAVRLAFVRDHRVHVPAQPVAHQRVVHHARQQDDVVRPADARHLGDGPAVLLPVHEVDPVALLLAEPAARAAQMRSRLRRQAAARCGQRHLRVHVFVIRLAVRAQRHDG